MKKIIFFKVKIKILITFPKRKYNLIFIGSKNSIIKIFCIIHPYVRFVDPNNRVSAPNIRVSDPNIGVSNPNIGVSDPNIRVS